MKNDQVNLNAIYTATSLAYLNLSNKYHELVIPDLTSINKFQKFKWSVSTLFENFQVHQKVLIALQPSILVIPLLVGKV